MKLNLNNVATASIILVAVTSIVSAFSFTTVIAQAARGDNAAIIALENSIAVLKWGGSAVVGALATAVAILYRANEKSNNTQRDDLISGLKAREELITKSLENGIMLQQAVHELSRDITELSDDIKKLVERG